MPDDAAWLINAAASSTPRAKTEVQIFAVRRHKEPIKSSQLNELLSINRHKAARGKQRVTRLLMFGIEVPTVKAVFEIQAGWATSNLRSTPVIAPGRNGKNVGRFEMPH